jgi:hypothetical protein
MKKVLIFFAMLIFSAFATQAQTILLTVADPVYDSVQDNVDTYFYLQGVSGTTNSTAGPHRIKAVKPITGYCLKELVVGYTHGQVQGSGDSIHFQVQASLDNSVWFYLSELPDQFAGTGTTAFTTPTGIWSSLGITAGLVETGLYTFTDGAYCFPYYRIKADNDATGHKLIHAYAILKQL